MGQGHSQNNYYNYQSTMTAKTKKRSSFRSPFMRRKQRSPLSATFTAPISSAAEALNINTATVEQLMTLPGVNRQIAQQIFEHRKAIGGRFQRIDDLALVSGIGAEKLEKIRPDICIKKSKTNSVHESSVSSRTVSLDSVISEPVMNTTTKIVLNINKATVFELQQLHEMNQEVAANVVDYRLRKGEFKKLDDLIKIKGMTRSRLGAIRPYLSLNDDDLPKTPKLIRHASTLSTVTPSKSNFQHNHHHRSHRRNSANFIHRKSLSLPVKMKLNMSNGYENNTPVSDIFELLGAYSHRPIVERDYRWERNGFSTIRLSSWNLDRMCYEKSENLGVKEVICRTILENRLSILCVQEIIDPEALKQFCCELNSPTLKRVQEWRENSHNWKYFVNQTCEDGWLNGLGFIYDADFCQLVENESTEINLNECILDDNYMVPPTAYLAAFRLSDWTCYVLNIYLKYYNLTNTNRILKCIEQQLDGRMRNSDIKLPTIRDVFLVAGDFTGMKYEIGEMYRKNLNLKRLNHLNDDHETSTSSTTLNVTTTTTSKTGNPINRSTVSLSVIEKCTEILDNDLNNDLNLIDNDLQNLGFFNIIKPNSTKLLAYDRNNYHNDDGLLSSCNILCREKLLNEKIILNKTIKVPFPKNGSEKLTGHFGIIKKGIHHMAIPKNWSWGGPASEYCPIWLEIYRRTNREHSVIDTTPLRNKLLNSSNNNINLNDKINKILLTNGDCCKTTTINNNSNNNNKINNNNNSIKKIPINVESKETDLDYDSTQI